LSAPTHSLPCPPSTPPILSFQLLSPGSRLLPPASHHFRICFRHLRPLSPIDSFSLLLRLDPVLPLVSSFSYHTFLYIIPPLLTHPVNLRQAVVISTSTIFVFGLSSALESDPHPPSPVVLFFTSLFAVPWAVASSPGPHSWCFPCFFLRDLPPLFDRITALFLFVTFPVLPFLQLYRPPTTLYTRLVLCPPCTPLVGTVCLRLLLPSPLLPLVPIGLGVLIFFATFEVTPSPIVIPSPFRRRLLRLVSFLSFLSPKPPGFSRPGFSHPYFPRTSLLPT